MVGRLAWCVIVSPFVFLLMGFVAVIASFEAAYKGKKASWNYKLDEM